MINTEFIMKLKEPNQCHLWQRKDLTPRDLTSDNFNYVETVAESDHFNRKVVRCCKCGQLYFIEYLRIQDRISGGEDLYHTFIPVEERDIPKVKIRDSFELLAVQPRLHWVNDRIFWIR